MAQTVIPGIETPENLSTSREVIHQCQQVLTIEPRNLECIKGLADTYFNINRLAESKVWQLKALDEDAVDADAAYKVAVIDYRQIHQNLFEEFRPTARHDDGQGNMDAPLELQEGVRVRNATLLDEALRYLNEALDDRPDFDVAMDYLELVYRRKADLAYGEPQVRDADLQLAKQWSLKAREIRTAAGKNPRSSAPIQDR